MTRKIAARATVVVWACAALSGCGEADENRALVVGIATEPQVLVPPVQFGDMEVEINGLLYRTLNSARWEGGELIYLADDRSLAQSWELSTDSTVLTYHLRPGLRWSDGHPVDAGDVKFTFELVRLPEIGSQAALLWERLDSVVAVAPDRVSFHFDRPYPGMLFDTGIGVIPEHIFEGWATDFDVLVSHPSVSAQPESLVVNGPYRVAAWERGTRIVLEPNPSYTGPSPSVTRVIFRLIPEESTRLIELEGGTIDVAVAMSPRRVAGIPSDDEFRIETMPDRFYDFIAWNSERVEPFADPEVRRALSLAIDRVSILGGLGMGPYARPAIGPYPAIFSAVFDPSLSADEYRPSEAREILRSRGWADADGDGVAEKAGRELRFTLLTQAGNPRRTYAAEVIQAQLAEVGVAVDLQLLEFNTLLGQVFEARDFEAVLLGWGVGLSPDYVLERFWPADGAINITGYRSEALDDLFPRAIGARTSADAAPLWKEAGRVIARDRPYAFLWYFDDLMVMRSGIENVTVDTYGLFQNLERWTLRR